MPALVAHPLFNLLAEMNWTEVAGNQFDDRIANAEARQCHKALESAQLRDEFIKRYLRGKCFVAGA